MFLEDPVFNHDSSLIEKVLRLLMCTPRCWKMAEFEPMSGPKDADTPLPGNPAFSVLIYGTEAKFRRRYSIGDLSLILD